MNSRMDSLRSVPISVEGKLIPNKTEKHIACMASIQKRVELVDESIFVVSSDFNVADLGTKAVFSKTFDFFGAIPGWGIS